MIGSLLLTCTYRLDESEDTSFVIVVLDEFYVMAYGKYLCDLQCEDR